MSTDVYPTKVWDYAAYAAIPADDMRPEIINGEHFMNPARPDRHSKIVSEYHDAYEN
jgi:hypothetical protein